MEFHKLIIFKKWVLQNHNSCKLEIFQSGLDWIYTNGFCYIFIFLQEAQCSSFIFIIGKTVTYSRQVS